MIAADPADMRLAEAGALITTLQVVGVAAAIAGCQRSFLCYCLEEDYAFRVPTLLSLYTASVAVEVAVARSTLTLIGWPFVVAMVATSNRNFPSWVYASMPAGCVGEACRNDTTSLHGILIFGVAIEAIAAFWRTWKYKYRVLMWTTIAFACLAFLSILAGGSPALQRMRAVVSAAGLVYPRIVAAATLGPRRYRRGGETSRGKVVFATVDGL